jgi:hypothetical protein
LKALREDFLAYKEQTEKPFIDTRRYIETHVAKTGAEIEKLTVQLMEAQEEAHKRDKLFDSISAMTGKMQTILSRPPGW